MKKFLILILATCCSSISLAQYVIYVSDEGRWGAGYNVYGVKNADGSETSMIDLRELALEKCSMYNATNCKLAAESNKAGWLAFIIGKNSASQQLFTIVDGQLSDSAAEASARIKYKELGGMDAENIEVNSMYVYNAYRTLEKVIEVKAGKQFKITLPKNASTGYSWVLERPLDYANIRSVSVKYIAPKKVPQSSSGALLMGTPGTQVWTFKAVHSSDQVIHLANIPPGSKTIPENAEVKSYVISIY